MGDLLMIWLHCFTIGANKAATTYLPNGLTVEALVGGHIFLQYMGTTGWAGRAAVQPVAVTVQAILDVVLIDGYFILLAYL